MNFFSTENEQRGKKSWTIFSNIVFFIDMRSFQITKRKARNSQLFSFHLGLMVFCTMHLRYWYYIRYHHVVAHCRVSLFIRSVHLYLLFGAYFFFFLSLFIFEFNARKCFKHHNYTREESCLLPFSFKRCHFILHFSLEIFCGMKVTEHSMFLKAVTVKNH